MPAFIKNIRVKADSKFYNKDGSLTAYAFSCGYIERVENERTTTEIYRENSCYHVRQFDTQLCIRVMWRSFDRLGKARRVYKEALHT